MKNPKSLLGLLGAGSLAFLACSCVSPIKQTIVIDPAIAATMPPAPPGVTHTVKVSISGDVSWGGKSAPIANGYFRKRLKNVVTSLPGYELTKESDADLVIYVKRNNKFNKNEAREKALKVARKQSAGETVPNLYDHVFTVKGPKGSWSGNVPHTVYFLYGDSRVSPVVGQNYIGAEHGGGLQWDDLVAGDEAMLRQVVCKALAEAKSQGCY